MPASPFTIEVIEEGVLRLTYRAPVTAETFRQATHDRVQFAAEHMPGPYVLIVDYTQATLTPSVLNPRLNSWSAMLDSNMLDAVLISRSSIATTAASLARRLTGRTLTLCPTFEEALLQARAVLARHAPAGVDQTDD